MSDDLRRAVDALEKTSRNQAVALGKVEATCNILANSVQRVEDTLALIHNHEGRIKNLETRSNGSGPSKAFSDNTVSWVARCFLATLGITALALGADIGGLFDP